MARAASRHKDRGCGLRRGHRVDGMLEHQHAVGGGDGHGAARTALADHDRNQRHAQRQASVSGAGNRLGLTALLGADAGIGAGRVDQRQHRQRELVGQIHQPHGLAVALRLGHAEIVPDPALGVGALLVADHDDGTVLEAADPAHDGGVLGEVAVAGHRREVIDQRVDVVEAVRPVGMARYLRLLPRRELGVSVDQRLLRLLLELRHLVSNGGRPIVAVERLQVGNLALQLGDRLLEVEIGAHCYGAIHSCVLPCSGSNGLFILDISCQARATRNAAHMTTANANSPATNTGKSQRSVANSWRQSHPAPARMGRHRLCREASARHIRHQAKTRKQAHSCMICLGYSEKVSHHVIRGSPGCS